MDKTEDHRPVTGVLRDLSPARLSLFGKLLQVGDGHGQELEDDRRTDVGHDPQGKDRKIAQGAARKHVKESQERPLGLLEEGRQGCRIDPRRRYMGADPVNRQEEKSKENSLLEFRYLGDIF